MHNENLRKTIEYRNTMNSFEMGLAILKHHTKKYGPTEADTRNEDVSRRIERIRQQTGK